MDVDKVSQSAGRKIDSKVKAAIEEAVGKISSSVEEIIKEEILQGEKKKEETNKKVKAGAKALREKMEEEEIKKKVKAGATALREKMEEERKAMDVEDVDRYEDMDPVKKAAWDKFLGLADYGAPSLLDKLIGSAARVRRARKPRDIPLDISPRMAELSGWEAEAIANEAQQEVRKKLWDFEDERGEEENREHAERIRRLREDMRKAERGIVWYSLVEEAILLESIYVAKMGAIDDRYEAGVITDEEKERAEEELENDIRKRVIELYEETVHENKETFEKEAWIRRLAKLSQWREKELAALGPPEDTTEAEEERKITEKIRKEEEREIKKRLKAKRKKQRARLRKEVENAVAAFIQQAEESGVKLRKKDISDYRNDLKEEYEERYGYKS